MIKAGAFDNLGGSRAQMMAGFEKAMQMGASLQADIQKGQMSLFGTGASDTDNDHETLPKVAPWSEMQMLTFEKEVLGFYVTANPLSRHAETINVYSTANTSQLDRFSEGAEIIIGGMVVKIRQIVTRNGKNAGAKMAVFELEDLQGSCEVVMFPRILEQFADRLKVDRILFVKGTVDCRRESPNVICDELIEIEEAHDKLAARVLIRLNAMDVTKEHIARIRDLCAAHRGKSRVNVTLKTNSGYRIEAVADAKLSVRPDEEFYKKMENAVGAGNVELRRR